MKQFRSSAEKNEKQIIFGRKSGPAKTIFGQKSGAAMAGPAVPPTTALQGLDQPALVQLICAFSQSKCLKQITERVVSNKST